MLRVLLVLLVACEEAPASKSIPDPRPAPTPLPLPSPTEHTTELRPTIYLDITTTELKLDRRVILLLTPSTDRKAIEDATVAALDVPSFDRETKVVMLADPSVTYERLIGILDGAKRAGFSKISFGVKP